LEQPALHALSICVYVHVPAEPQAPPEKVRKVVLSRHVAVGTALVQSAAVQQELVAMQPSPHFL
jgi:hypothetical protein